MRIAILATGSRGDVQPYIALGAGLLQAGHNVRIVTFRNFENLATDHGLDFWPVDIDVQDIAQNDAMRERVAGGNFLSLMAQMAKEAEGGAVRLAQAGLEACRGVDLMLAGMGGLYIGLALGEKLDLPLLQAHLVPFTPTAAFAGVLVGNPPGWLGGPFNRLSHHLTRQVIWQGFRTADRRARVEVLEVPPAPFSGPYNASQMDGLPELYGFSPAVIPPPPDWGPQVHVTGYWFLEAGEAWSPPAALSDFLAAGPPPVYIGFGSMSNRDPRETAGLVLEALRLSGQRAVLLSGWGGLQSADLPGTVLMIDSAPHAWLFPHMAAVVHHGGAGTTGAGLRSGVPSMAVPFFGDQPFWGRRIAELGAGPGPIPRKRLTAAGLAQALETMVNDETMRRRAAELGGRIQAEDGVARAVEIINGVDHA